MSVCGVQNVLKCVLFLGLFPGHFLLISDSNFRRLGLPNRGFRTEGIAKIDVSWKSFSQMLEWTFVVLGQPWELFF